MPVTNSHTCPHRLLAVDDNHSILEIYEDVFALAGADASLQQTGARLFGGSDQPGPAPGTWPCYELTTARSGRLACQEVARAQEARRPFTAAFIDLCMPDMDGLETAAEILRLEPGIQIALVTGGQTAAQTDRLPAWAEDQIWRLCKPFGITELLRLAREMTTRRQQSSQALIGVS